MPGYLDCCVKKWVFGWIKNVGTIGTENNSCPVADPGGGGNPAMPPYRGSRGACPPPFWMAEKDTN